MKKVVRHSDKGERDKNNKTNLINDAISINFPSLVCTIWAVGDLYIRPEGVSSKKNSFKLLI